MRTRAVQSLAALVGIASLAGLTLYLALASLLPLPLASTIALGVGVGGAVYVERRYVRSDPAAVADALLFGFATAGGWAAAQFLIRVL
ncbi:MAG: hypothetical protein KY467_01245 [Gemmatimonadetes bacterium]|nr:hypothetical protein [Gemmatimonadota bacterium]